VNHREAHTNDRGSGRGPVPENFDTRTALLRVSDTEVEVLDLGTSLCTADYGIPLDVAAQIAPPGVDPAGDCPTPSRQQWRRREPDDSPPGRGFQLFVERCEAASL
jgi:hypothetical protein